ncbi:Flp family type IVb pilin [Hyphomicrobium sp. LHD-15]|uniref:Flp family type IVb pilin n=1 Tax=Hyphomicrobium sp. LHD-15 TaxID=3072142 RepID=UPI00280CAD1B|nr:Flp family type IVb pilin [Hyphomicrobium sp. LHD-15]MDQ8699327.1 Flp family type IVb pilin [Hyphomicrobium sp. LHD-15]
MKALLFRFCADDRGTTAIEYALIAGIISIAIVGALHQIAPAIEGNFTTAADALDQ